MLIRRLAALGGRSLTVKGLNFSTEARRVFATIPGSQPLARIFICKPALQLRYFATEPNGTSEQESPRKTTMLDHILNTYVSRLNHAFTFHPHESAACMVGMDILSIYGTYTALGLLGLDFSANFALAFALSRTVRRLRLPMELAVAGVLAKMAPQLREVKFSRLIERIIGRAPQAPWENKDGSPTSNRMLGLMQKAADLIDHYGLAYMLASRLSGLAVVTTMYMCLEYGIDVVPYLEKWGFGQVGDVLGQWAAAVVFSAALWPVYIQAVPTAAGIIGRARKGGVM